MKNRSALVIVYTGEPASFDEQRALVEFFCKNCDKIASTQDVTVYGLEASDIARGVVIKATQGEKQLQEEEPINVFDEAAAFIGEHFKSSISSGIPTFAANIATVYVSIKLRGMCNLTEKEARFIESIELLAQEGAWNAISSKILRKYHITLGIVNAIKNMYDGACQGQHIGW